jgi:predicted nucleotidyltransferase
MSGTAQTVASLAPEAVAPLQELKQGLEQALGSDLAALVVYGSAVRGGYDPATSDVDVIVVLRDTSLPKLVACSNPLLVARYQARVEAMVLKLDEIAQSADVFPLFYDDVRGCHVVLSGSDPFAGILIHDEHRRLRIEQELRETKIRMRRAVVDAMGVEDALRGAVGRKIKQIRGPLGALLRLRGRSSDGTLAGVFGEVGRAYGIDTAPLLAVARDPAAAHAVLRRVLDAAIDDVDQAPAGAAS